MELKIGITSGPAYVGNMGSKSHLSFSIVGGMVVLASSLVKLNHVIGTEILICSNTWRDVKEFYFAKMV